VKYRQKSGYVTERHLRKQNPQLLILTKISVNFEKNFGLVTERHLRKQNTTQFQFQMNFLNLGSLSNWT